ncbi:MAG: ATP-binding protein [Leptolyngbyaceae cyanobacterium]
MLPSWLAKLKPRRVGQQISYGYFAAIAIGGAGTLTGMVIADYFQGRGVTQLLDAQAQTQFLSDFDRAADQAQIHGVRAVAFAGKPDQQQAELTDLRAQLATMVVIRQEVNTFIQADPAWLADNPEHLQVLLETYEQQLNEYAEAIFAAVQTENPKAALPDLLAGETTESLDQFHDQLAALVQISRGQESTATNVMETAQGAEKALISISMVIAALVAGFVAWRTTRAIAIPLSNITRTTRRVADQANYQLRAKVGRNDEIGLLAQSVNHLIATVAARTQSLEQAVQLAAAQNQDLANTLATLQKTQTQLLHSEKMSSLGQLVAGIAHEINNPIGFIQGNLAHARDYGEILFAVIDRLQAAMGELPPELADYLAKEDVDFIRGDFPQVIRSLRNGSDRIDTLVQSLKVFARSQEASLKPTNLNEGLESTLLLLEHRLKPQAKRPEIEVIRCCDDLPTVECYGGQINQVFMNILSNAVDAISERWATTFDDWRPQILIRTLQIDESVRVEIQNNGLAMPEPVQAKIFDPFFTTKPVGGGVGLGMSVSYEIIAQHHQGKLDFISPWQGEIGTKFMLTLPIRFSTPLSPIWEKGHDDLNSCST